MSEKAARMPYTVLFMARDVPSSILALESLTRDSAFSVTAVVARECDVMLHGICEKNAIPVVTEDDVRRFFQHQEASVDYLFSFYWKRIGKDILSIPQKGAINFHQGPLPEARGSGYHAAILEDWGYWGVTAHYMDAEFDTGRIIRCDRFPIPEKILNDELVALAHAKAAKLFNTVLHMIKEGTLPLGEVQMGGRYFSRKDMESAKEIAWNDKQEAIDRKIRAFWHPPYGGAWIELDGKRYTLVEETVLQAMGNRFAIESQNLK